MKEDIIVLGAGMTGLGAGLSGIPVYEAAEGPGGICSSYYMRPDATERMPFAPSDGEAYRFELGGGHWIFGGDPAVLRLIRSVAPVKTYERKSSVWLPAQGAFVPYPLQNHLRCLGPQLAAKCLKEMVDGLAFPRRTNRMSEWLEANFGGSLCEMFFTPFHKLYTAGLWEKIAPQDGYKSPLDMGAVLQGTLSSAPPVGYNTTFIYPEEGLNVLAQRLAASCDIRYGKKVMRIDPTEKEIEFADGTRVGYETLVSTLPLNKVMEMTGLRVDAKADPSPSVLVVNIGAERGPKCPDDHWVYLPSSRAGFHRVGFYSNVDCSFLPQSAREGGERVSIYVEKAYPEGARPSATEAVEFSKAVVKELQQWEWVGDAEAIDPTWIEVAYTWSWSGSSWKQQALKELEATGIYQVGRYARWVFQGIADSLRDGLLIGAAMSASRQRD